ncbi:MAG: alpha-N-arabinofuranosidase, partial [Bryobacteraceae bacterium]
VNDVVRDATVTTAGYQGTPAPNQWFGGPALAAPDYARPGRPVNAGAMILRDAAGLVVDSLNYGLMVDPWAAEGYQAASGAGEGGCRVAMPPAGGGFGPGTQAVAVTISAGRVPDGFDADSNCTDFQLQPVTALATASSAGATNIKVDSVSDFAPGQTITIDAGGNQETAVVALVGTAGATTVTTAAAAGATAIAVAGATGFSAGQTINVDDGRNFETAVIVSIARGPGGRGGARGPGGATITLARPLMYAHAAGAQVSGSGITLTSALTRGHAGGAQVVAGAATPGAPNRYYSSGRR